MKQPDSMDIGTRMDVVKHRLEVVKEDLDTAHLTFNIATVFYDFHLVLQVQLQPATLNLHFLQS